MELDPELKRQIQEAWNRPPRPLTEQQIRRIQWSKDRFETPLEEVKQRPVSGNVDEVIKHLASIQLLERISRFVNHVAHGVGLLGLDEDGVLKFQLSVFELGGNVGEAGAAANVRAGSETAAFLENLLRPYDLPDGVRIVHERYVPVGLTGMPVEEYERKYPDTGSLSQYDFNYFVIVPFPD